MQTMMEKKGRNRKECGREKGRHFGCVHATEKQKKKTKGKGRERERVELSDCTTSFLPTTKKSRETGSECSHHGRHSGDALMDPSSSPALPEERLPVQEPTDPVELKPLSRAGGKTGRNSAPPVTDSWLWLRVDIGVTAFPGLIIPAKEVVEEGAGQYGLGDSRCWAIISGENRAEYAAPKLPGGDTMSSTVRDLQGRAEPIPQAASPEPGDPDWKRRELLLKRECPCCCCCCCRVYGRLPSPADSVEDDW